MAVINVNKPSTMVTKSVTKATEETNKESVEETFLKMKGNLIRYARSNDRRMVLRSLMDVKLLRCLSLDVAQNSEGPLFDLEKEVAEASLILNGVEIRGVSLYDTNSCIKDTVTSGIKNSSIPILKTICREFCERNDVNMSSRELYEKVIVRLAKSTSSADPYFRLNSLLGSPDLLVMPLDDEVMPSSAVATVKNATTSMHARNEESKAGPTALNLYVAGGEVHFTLYQTYTFGLLRKADVKTNRPWLTIQGLVKERGNFSTNNSVRQLKVILPENIY